MSWLTVVSDDGHVAEPVEMYTPYPEQRYRPEILELYPENVEYLHTFALATRPKREVLEVFDTRFASRTGDEFGSFDITRRLQEMDPEGIAAQVIHPATQVATPGSEAARLRPPWTRSLIEVHSRR